MTLSKATPEVKAAIVESVRNGAYAKHAAQAAGICEKTLYLWVDADVAFATAIAQAKAERTNAAIQRIADHGMRDWKADAWLLERTQPADFIQRTATEVTGADGGPLTIATVPVTPDELSEAARALVKVAS